VHTLRAPILDFSYQVVHRPDNSVFCNDRLGNLPDIDMGKLINCPGCEKPIGANAYTCPHCGCRRTSPVTWLFATVLIVIFTTAIFGSAQAQETGIRLAQEGDWYQKLCLTN